MERFQLTKREEKRANKFIKKQSKKYLHLDDLRNRWSYIFTPTSIGMSVHVQDNIKNKIKDITDYTTW